MIPIAVYELLKQHHIEYQSTCALTSLSTFRIGGTVELAIFPDSRERLAAAVRILRETDTPFAVLGNGSNILFGDGMIEGALVLTKRMSGLTQYENTIVADCGASLASLAMRAAEAELTGLEFARGIPGTVGGAIFMNAGAYGGSISDVLKKSWALNTENGDVFELSEHAFAYRSSVYMNQRKWICLGGEFSLSRGNGECIYATMQELSCRRKEKQPLEYPSAGSYFKRPDGYFAGKLIEDCGLKGYRVGGAAVSKKHAGFLINLGGATAKDMLVLEEHVKNEVLRRFGVVLEREVRVIQSLKET